MVTRPRAGSAGPDHEEVSVALVHYLPNACCQNCINTGAVLREEGERESLGAKRQRENVVEYAFGESCMRMVEYMRSFCSNIL